jgi:peptidoglycan hydrolase-like protein with peptidoglycan-binding domain
MSTIVEVSRIALTSPPMDGEPVSEAQRLLQHNPYGTFDPGPADGLYGERTADAVRRAKYWLGYPERRLDRTFDPELRALLAGDAEASPTHRATRTRRLRRAAEMRMWAEAYDLSISAVGTREQPAGSFHTEFGTWYGVTGPWAAIFVSWCYAHAGSTAFGPGRYAYVPDLLADARRSQNHLSLTLRPLLADLAVFDLDGDRRADHVGLFDRWLDDAESHCQTVEGNVSLAGTANGGRVLQRDRQRADIVAFVHVRG